MMVEVLFKKLRPAATLPTYAKMGDAGMDIYAFGNWIIPVGATRVIDTGIAMAIPYGFYGSGRERSGLAARGIRLGGGVIDSGYRGEVRAVLTNFGNEPLQILQGDRIFQIIIRPLPTVILKEVEELPESERGEGGFGSTGI